MFGAGGSGSATLICFLIGLPTRKNLDSYFNTDHKYREVFKISTKRSLLVYMTVNAINRGANLSISYIID